MGGLQRYIRQLLPLGDSKIDNGIYLWFQWVFWHWQADSFPLSHQGSPSVSFLCLWAIILYSVATELSRFWITNVNLGPKPSWVPLATILSGLLWVLWLQNQGLWSAILVGPRLRGVGVVFSVKTGEVPSKSGWIGHADVGSRSGRRGMGRWERNYSSQHLLC